MVDKVTSYNDHLYSEAIQIILGQVLLRDRRDSEVLVSERPGAVGAAAAEVP